MKCSALTPVRYTLDMDLAKLLVRESNIRKTGPEDIVVGEWVKTAIARGA